MKNKSQPVTYYTKTIEEILKKFNSSLNGMTLENVDINRTKYGPNALPQSKAPGLITVFLMQFKSPLVYILIIATVFSLIIHEYVDAIFIAAVLVVNAIIGTVQEFSAERAAQALQKLSVTACKVLRDNITYEINSEELVPGDIVLLESGNKVPADIRLTDSKNLEVDESLLTGESLAVSKNHICHLEGDTTLGDRKNMVHAGTIINHGRAKGIVVSTALGTEIGHIAQSVLGKVAQKSPLIVRMEKFTNKVALIIAAVAMVIALVALQRGLFPSEIFMLVVALAVSTIPEGLPVAITIALAISMHRMAKRHVIVRQLVAVEALGSCTFIASDKTGTLTQNKLNVSKVVLPDNTELEVGEYLLETDNLATNRIIKRLYQTAVLANEGSLGIHDEKLVHHGDPTDVALLIMAYKNGYIRKHLLEEFPEISTIPFESSYLISASLNKISDNKKVFVKGALEKLISMCSHMATSSDNNDIAIDRAMLEEQGKRLASQGYRVLAFAQGLIADHDNTVQHLEHTHLQNLTFLGLVGIIDPLRQESQDAVKECQKAGVNVAMITGDHPCTAKAIAEQLNLCDQEHCVVTGTELKDVDNIDDFDHLVKKARVFARIEPKQKFDIIQSLQRQGHFVAVSGDGANDAPALRSAEVGVAMGKNGTDLAKEAAKLIITDDNFSSIVAGIEEGRIAYANIRKVIFLLLSTGAAELVLFILALLFNLPIPLVAVQLLWLNLVTNGIQDVALAFEPGEGNEMSRPPRSPQEPIFNKIMIERIVVSALFMGITAFIVFGTLLNSGMNEQLARNSTLLLMVLFENVHVFNCRSETNSVFKTRLLTNPLLIFGTLIAQLIHIAAMYTPGLSTALKVQPVSFSHWLQLLGVASLLLVVMEAQKFVKNKFCKNC